MTTILIIEDNESARENINDILELEGFETLVASHGQQGLELAQQHIPDLIICDVMMPKLNGYEVLEALSQQEDLATIPFIFLTAKSTRQDFRQGMALGSSDYLTKPFSPSELVSAVCTQLHKKELVEKRYTEQLEKLKHNINQLSHVDALTDLPNQAALKKRLEQYVAEQQTFSLFVISVDQFSLLSSTLSSAESDELIKLIAQRIQKVFPHGNKSASIKELFRIGQNQFAVLSEHIEARNENDASSVNRFFNLLSAPYRLDSQAINITVSIGITSSVDSKQESQYVSDVENLIRDAKTALYEAQKAGGNDYCFYCKDMTLNIFERLDIANALHYALQQGEFELYYQPQVDLETESIVGAEALVRWKSTQLGWISPSKFIAIAEEIGIIADITNWILWTACEQAVQWQTTLAEPVSVSVNISPMQLAQTGLCDTVRTVLRKTELEPRLLCLEVTENALIKNREQAAETLQKVREMGVRVAIDDFGTGYSGLDYLSSFPFNTVKIDRMFVQDIFQRYGNQKIVSAVINMSHDLNLNVVAEGAETADELLYLKQQGCDRVQGYVYAKPMSAEDFTSFVSNQRLPKFATCNVNEGATPG